MAIATIVNRMTTNGRSQVVGGMGISYQGHYNCENFTNSKK